MKKRQFCVCLFATIIITSVTITILLVPSLVMGIQASKATKNHVARIDGGCFLGNKRFMKSTRLIPNIVEEGDRFMMVNRNSTIFEQNNIMITRKLLLFNPFTGIITYFIYPDAECVIKYTSDALILGIITNILIIFISFIIMKVALFIIIYNYFYVDQTSEDFFQV